MGGSGSWQRAAGHILHPQGERIGATQGSEPPRLQVGWRGQGHGAGLRPVDKASSGLRGLKFAGELVGWLGASPQRGWSAGCGTFTVPWVPGYPSWPRLVSAIPPVLCLATEPSNLGRVFGAVLSHPQGSVPANHGDLRAWGPVARGRLLSRVSLALCGRCEAALRLAPAPSHCKPSAVLCRAGFVCARVSAESSRAFFFFSLEGQPSAGAAAAADGAGALSARLRSLLLRPESSQPG